MTASARWGLAVGLLGLAAWLLYALGRGAPGGTSMAEAPRSGPRDRRTATADAGPGGSQDAPWPAERNGPTATGEITTSDPVGAAPVGLDEPGRGMTLEALARRRAFLAEARDPAWADGREARLRGPLADLPVTRGAFTGIQCRATICRATFRFDDGGAMGDNGALFEELRRLLGMRLATEEHMLDGGGVQLGIWVAR